MIRVIVTPFCEFLPPGGADNLKNWVNVASVYT